jgi:hypothetical protein
VSPTEFSESVVRSSASSAGWPDQVGPLAGDVAIGKEDLFGDVHVIDEVPAQGTVAVGIIAQPLYFAEQEVNRSFDQIGGPPGLALTPEAPIQGRT